MTKEEFVKKWDAQLEENDKKEMTKDLDALIWMYMKKNGLVVGSKKV